MQNLPKLKTRKIAAFKSSFLENLTKESKQNSQNDSNLLKVSSYEASFSLQPGGIREKSLKNMEIIKKGLKKIFENKQKIAETAAKDERNRENVENVEEKRQISSFHVSSQENIERNPAIPKRKNAGFPKIEAFDFKSFLGKKIEERRKNIFGNSLIKLFPAGQATNSIN